MNDTTLEDLHGLALELKSMIAMAPELSREPLLRKAREIEKLAEKAVEDSKVQEPEPSVPSPVVENDEIENKVEDLSNE